MNSKLSQLGLFLGVMVLALTIPVAVFLATQDKNTTLYSRAGLTGSAFLYFWPAVISVPVCPSETALSSCPKSKVQIFLNTKDAVSGGADIVIKYDPRIIRIVDNKIFPGSVDDNFTLVYQVFNYYRDSEVDNRSGLIKIKSSGNYKGERGIIATFFVNGLSVGESKLEFLAGGQYVDASKVWDEKEQNNILGGVEGGVVKVQ